LAPTFAAEAAEQGLLDQIRLTRELWT
jgi:hypothetical protein